MSSEDPIALMVFTRDLRIEDNPALRGAANGSKVVCAFVHDAALRSGPSMDRGRMRFLAECLADLDGSLRRIGSRLEEREGVWVDEVLRLVAETGARTIHLADDVTPYARRRFSRLEAAAGRSARVWRTPGLTIVPPGVAAPEGGDHYRVFTPYYRRWSAVPRRQLLAGPATLRLPQTATEMGGSGPRGTEKRSRSETRRGGERAARARLAAWHSGALASYGERRDDLDEPATSRLSTDLHFGCLSPLAVESALVGRPGSVPFLRQLCWRDFYLQLLAARPEVAWSGYLHKSGRPATDPVAFEAWRRGCTGVPIVDAAMRQLAAEGFIPNRARMIAASFLTKNLGADWRDGARHFLEHLVDADVALNNLNWQWVAGLGTGSNPHRVLNPTRQARRFDPSGAYVRRHVPELRGLDRPAVHEPWVLGRRELARLGYPEPVVSVGEIGP